VNLYVLRHAEAAGIGGTVTRDVDRPLTAKGEQDAAMMGQALALLEPALSHVLTSPLVRAARTAELVTGAFRTRPIVRASDNVAPGIRIKTVLEELAGLGSATSVLLVGHQPDMGNFISSLIAGDSGAAIAMAPCAVAKIVLQQSATNPDARLVWLLTPETVRRHL
jgi:phosphohistidine phosphatase